MDKSISKLIPSLQTLGIPFRKFKDFIFPVTRRERKQRMLQIKDVSIFFVSIALFVFFEDKISNALSVDSDEVQKLAQSQNTKT